MMSLACALAFSSISVAYYIAAVKLLSVAVAVAPPLGGIKGVGVGSIAEDSDTFIIILGLLALKFAPLLVELPCEVGVCCPPLLIVCLLPFVQEFGLEHAIGVHMGHKVVHLVAVGDSEPMVFTLDLVHFQLARKCGDVRV